MKKTGLFVFFVFLHIFMFLFLIISPSISPSHCLHHEDSMVELQALTYSQQQQSHRWVGRWIVLWSQNRVLFSFVRKTTCNSMQRNVIIVAGLRLNQALEQDACLFMLILLFQVVLPVCCGQKSRPEVVWKRALDCSKTASVTDFTIHTLIYIL